MIAITNRKLCRGDFLKQVEILAQSREVEAVILREKDLPEEEYLKLAGNVLACCGRYQKKCILHSFVGAAKELCCPGIHLPFSMLIQYQGKLDGFSEVGTSVHSTDEAKEAAAMGATYLIAGHIFETDCKRGLPGRGIEFLRQVCQAVEIPVYGIGGITPEKLPMLVEAGAAGGCVMSLAMQMKQRKL